MLLVGTRINDSRIPVLINFDGLLHHTLVVGQSGSGKSFFIARLLEEILLRTRARLFIIDPNGDFRNLSKINDAIWTRETSRFAELDRHSSKNDRASFDKSPLFADGWKKRRFAHLIPGFPTLADTENEIYRKLIVHWDQLDDDHRHFLLQGREHIAPNVALGLETVVEASQLLEADIPELGFGYDLRGLENMADRFLNKDNGFSKYPKAKILTTDDWQSVRGRISELRTSYQVWWSKTREQPLRPPSLTDFIDGAFNENQQDLTYWDSLVVALDAAEQPDTLLVVDVALARLWRNAKDAWRRRSEDPAAHGNLDKRVPTFIVVDEAHNFAPETQSSPLRARVTARLMQIASEGRKYGLYLILATQRPTKLHRELVPECENSCLLRVQSDSELKFAQDVLGFSGSVSKVKDFTQGLGLFNGRWLGTEVAGSIDTRVAPARTVVGGGGLNDQWKTAPDPTPSVSNKGPTVDGIAKRVEQLLKLSNVPIVLATLAFHIKEEYDLSDRNWLGYETFKQLLTHGNIPGLRFLSHPPGLAYLEGVHELGPSIESSYSIDLSSVPEALQAIVWECHLQLNMPIFRPDDLSFIISSISKLVQSAPFDFSSVSKAVRDESSVGRTVPIGRNPINFVIKGIMLSGHTFVPDLPQDSQTLANAFSGSVIEGLRRKNVEIDDETRALLRGYLSGGILDEPTNQKIEDLSQ